MPNAAFFPLIASGSVTAYRAATKLVSEGLSFAAELASPAAGDIAPIIPSADVAAPSAELSSELDALAQQLIEALQAAGLSTEETAELSLDGIGGIDVDLGHSQSSEIASLLASNPQLLERIRQVAEKIIAETASDTAAPRDVRLLLEKEKLSFQIES